MKKVVICKLCNIEFENEEPNEEELLAHLFEKHVDLLISLGIGLRNEVEK